MKLEEILDKNYMIYDQYEDRYFYGFFKRPDWVRFNEIYFEECLPKIMTKNEAYKEMNKIHTYYMKVDGECEGISVIKGKVIPHVTFTVEHKEC